MKAIVVVDRNWGIGCQGKLLAHLPEDLKYFKQKTLGKVVVMGRETLESFPSQKPLSGRTNIVLSGNECYEADCPVCHSMDNAMDVLDEYSEDDIFVIGGGQIYSLFLPYCSEVFVTKIDEVYPADRYFENLDKSDEWIMTEESDERQHEGVRYRFTKYVRAD